MSIVVIRGAIFSIIRLMSGITLGLLPILRKKSLIFYTGETREKALASRPKRKLEFQDPPLAPHPKWFSILAWGMTARAYIDDLLIYEGGEPINLAVEPIGKLTTRWGQLKRGQPVFWNQNAVPSYIVYK